MHTCYSFASIHSLTHNVIVAAYLSMSRLHQSYWKYPGKVSAQRVRVRVRDQIINYASMFLNICPLCMSIHFTWALCLCRCRHHHHHHHRCRFAMRLNKNFNENPSDFFSMSFNWFYKLAYTSFTQQLSSKLERLCNFIHPFIHWFYSIHSCRSTHAHTHTCPF